MKHARADYDRIQDPANLIGEDEPVFLVRAQDICGPYTVQAWAENARLNGASPEIVQKAIDWAHTMRRWQLENSNKVPDL